MALVVADIGGTSSRWGVVREGQELFIIEGLPGFNPATDRSGPFVEAIGARFRSENLIPAELFVYAAGCGSPDRAGRMSDALRSVWPSVTPVVATDLLGAACGLLGRNTGLVLILGTGMNFGRYDGDVLHQPLPSLGYILGDEGSGADIGKHLLREALRGRVPPDVMRATFPEGLVLSAVIERLYRGPAPQRWLASFTGRLAPLATHPWVHELIGERFRELARVIAKGPVGTPERAVHATGSVAHGFEDLLREALAGEGFSPLIVRPSPLPGRLRYHAAHPRH